MDDGRPGEAQAAVDRAARIAAELLDKQPGVWDHAALAATVCQRQAELAAARGEATLAAEWFGKVVTMMRPQLAKPACQAEAEARISAAEAGLLALDAGPPAAKEPPAEPVAPALTSQP